VKSVDERENEKKQKRKKQTKRREKRDKNSLSFSLPKIGGVGGVVCIPRNAAALVFFLPIAKRRRRSNSNTLSLSSERKKRGEERARATEEERIRNVFQGFDSRVRIGIFVRELEQKRPRVV